MDRFAGCRRLAPSQGPGAGGHTAAALQPRVRRIGSGFPQGRAWPVRRAGGRGSARCPSRRALPAGSVGGRLAGASAQPRVRRLQGAGKQGGHRVRRTWFTPRGIGVLDSHSSTASVKHPLGIRRVSGGNFLPLFNNKRARKATLCRGASTPPCATRIAGASLLRKCPRTAEACRNGADECGPPMSGQPTSAASMGLDVSPWPRRCGGKGTRTVTVVPASLEDRSISPPS